MHPSAHPGFTTTGEHRRRSIVLLIAFAILATVGAGMAGAYGYRVSCDGYAEVDWEACADANRDTPNEVYLENDELFVGQPANFEGYASNSELSDTVAWDWGADGTVDQTGAKVQKTFDSAGYHDLRVTVTSTDGKVASRVLSLNVRSSADAVNPQVWSWGEMKPGATVYFEAYAYDAGDESQFTYAWTFGDGTSGTGSAPQHVYAAPGDYKVTATINRPGSTPLIATRWVRIANDLPPAAGFAWRPVHPLAGTFVTIHAAGGDPDDYGPGVKVLNYVWDFNNDGASDVTTVDPVVIRQFGVGEHTVKLRVNLVNGGFALRERVISVAPVPAGTQLVSMVAAAGQTVSTPGPVSASNPVSTSVTSPTAGAVTIVEGPTATEDPDGFDLLGHQVQITAPDGTRSRTGTELIRFVFTVDSSLLPAGKDVELFRNGEQVPGCAADEGYPCIVSRETVDGDLVLTVDTFRASVWNFGVAGTATPPDNTGNGGGQNNGGTDTGGGGGGTTTPPATTPTTPVTPAGPVAPTLPEVAASIAKQRLKTLFAKGFKANVDCSAACALDVSLKLDAKTARKLKLARALGKTTVSLPAAGKKAVVVKLGAKARKKLKRARSVKLTLVITGGASPVTKTVTVKR